MSPIVVDVWAVSALVLAAGCLALRSNMLRPHMSVWSSSPAPVFLALSFQSAVLGGAAWSIMGGSHASLREAIAYTAVAVASLAMLVNLAAQRQAASHRTVS
jgi:hypothetical protein